MDRKDNAQNRRLQDQIAAEAADWFARLQDPEAPATDRDEFAQWLLRSPVHIEEYLAVTRVWGDAAAISDLSVDELVRQAREEPESANVVAFDETLTPTLSQRERGQSAVTPTLSQRERGKSTPTPALSREREREKNPSPSPRSRGQGGSEGFWWRAIAATVVVAALGWFTVNEWLHPSHIDTAIGEQRSVTLSDGSIVFLNTNSEATLDLSETTRRVTLERGEARFTVARDPKRPFLVTTQQAAVRAVGTVFNVQARDEATAVTVIEGKVALAHRDATTGSLPDSTSVAGEHELSAGQHAEVTASGEILPDAGPSLERVLAWSDRRLIFRDDPLADVVAEFNRYHKRPIRIEDPALAALRISGTFDATDPRSLIQYLERYERVSTHEQADGTQYLTR